MSEAREWAERMRAERPSLLLGATDTNCEASLSADVHWDDASCEITVVGGGKVDRVKIPYFLAVALGQFLVRTYSEPADLLHGRPHDAKMREDHA